ncbi:Xpc [Symbiodinium sp. CCMP2592]|nr:Xpc [Symbiodinium sp. CCMP2592]
MRLALPGPVGPSQRKFAKKSHKARAKVEPRQAYQRAQLLSWLGRLRYLHSACCSPFLQAVCLSVWGEDVPRSGLPTLEELLSSFHGSLHHQAVLEPVCSSLLLQACHCAQTRQGRHLDLAVCFVALCRALGLPARLVLAFNLAAPKPPPKIKEAPAEAEPEDVAQVIAESDEEGPGMESLLEGTSRETASTLRQMGFAKDAVMSAVLQAEEDGPTDVLDRALTLLTEGSRPSQPRHLKRPKTFKQTKLQGDCPFCGARFQTGAFCTNCGKRLRGGGPTGAADLQKQAAPDAEADDDIVEPWRKAEEAVPA